MTLVLIAFSKWKMKGLTQNNLYSREGKTLMEHLKDTIKYLSS